MAKLLAHSSGADLAAIGIVSLVDRRIANMCISTGEANPELSETDAIRAVSQAVASQLSLLRSDPALRVLNADQEGNVDTRQIWLRSTRHLIGIGDRHGKLAAFTALIYNRTERVDTPERRNLIRIGLTYASQQLSNWASLGSETGSPLLPDAILRSLSFGFIVVDALGAVDYVKDSSQGWLAKSRDIEIQNRRLSSENPRNQHMLQSALAAATGPQRKTSVLQLESQEGNLPDTLIILPIQDTQPRALVIFGQDQEDSTLRDLLLQTFGLTLAERRLTHHLLAGRSLAEAAVEANLTISTARSYLKRIFAKTGMHRQSELVTLCHRMMPSVKAAGAVAAPEPLNQD